MSYQLTGEGWVHRLADEARIPMVEANADYQAYLAWLAAGNTPLPAPPDPPEVVKARLSLAVQQHLDATAQAYRYEGILSARTAAGSHIPKFAAEGSAFNRWWGETWAAVDQVEKDVANGLRPVPTVAELLAELPTLEIPA